MSSSTLANPTWILRELKKKGYQKKRPEAQNILGISSCGRLSRVNRKMAFERHGGRKRGTRRTASSEECYRVPRFLLRGGVTRFGPGKRRTSLHSGTGEWGGKRGGLNHKTKAKCHSKKRTVAMG